MSEPTTEQIAAEMPRAREALGQVRFYHPIIGDDVARSVADVLARVRIEALAAGRDEGLDAAERECQAMADSELSSRWTRATIGALLVKAIRALRGRT